MAIKIRTPSESTYLDCAGAWFTYVLLLTQIYTCDMCVELSEL